MRAEMVIKGVRHALAVTVDTCFHINERIKLISTYLETHIIDSENVDSTDHK